MKRRRILLAAVILALLGGAGAVYYVYRAIAATHDAYAVEQVADMAIVYMETHDGAWPRNWEDLRTPYETCINRSSRPWTFEKLRARVDVDWEADPAQLATAPDTGAEPPFKVIWLRSGRQTHWRDHEPNRMILDYLRNRKPGR
jgi:hypothetical protein